jgi:hypothetical protein
MAVHRFRRTRFPVVRIDFADPAELLAAAPDIYYVTDHYVEHPSVLVRLSRVTPDILRDLLGMAHKYVSSRSSPRSNKRKSAKSPSRK